jgi:DNA-binding Lrp family transcriptional regulator
MNRLELDLLSYLGQDPLAPNVALARRLSISRENVAKLIERLRKEGHLHGISAQVNYSRVGLEMVACMLRCDADAWPFLERMCLAHPYTRYRIRCLGPFNALFTLFAIPPGSVGLLLELFENLIDQRKIYSYDLHIPIANLAVSETDFRRYTPDRGWIFDWLSWEENWDRRLPTLDTPLPSILNRLDKGDIRILQQISRDILRTQSEIARDAKVSESKASRKIPMYQNEKIISSYRVLLGFDFLTGLASAALFRCRSNFVVVKTIAAALSKLPFQCTLIPETQGFLLYASLPSLDIPIVTSILKRHCSSVETFWCDYRSSYRWALDSDSFAAGNWKSDYDYMVHHVLRKIGTQSLMTDGVEKRAN